MKSISQIRAGLIQGRFDSTFSLLYGDNPDSIRKQRSRYVAAVDMFGSLFGEEREAELFSTPGRTEVGGNHTDHNAGRVLAAAVDLDVIAVASVSPENRIRIQSEGYPLVTIGLEDVSPRDDERYTTAALIRGVCGRLKELGYHIGGFDAYVTSNVLVGSGLSSSAAFEVLVTSILNCFCNGSTIDDVQNAIISQYAENNYFGKPCGLMDQTTCAVGGFVTIDFKDFERPVVEKVDFDFSRSGYSMVIVDTGGSHADLNDDYAALEHEMKEVARAFGGQVLREFSLEKVVQNIALLRTKVSDRAILRAFHFYYDDQRVADQVKALRAGNFDAFLRMVIDSGENSWMLCQNCYAPHRIEEQGVSVALALSERILKGKGAWRVHGGGFAGTIQAFVPDDMITGYVDSMKDVFGADSCHKLIIRTVGTARVKMD